MKLAAYGINEKATHRPADTIRLAQLAEELGYDSWWAGEHVVLPDPADPAQPLQPHDAILDPLVHLAFVAAVTTTLELGTGIIILPQRNPVVLAKEVASLDVLSNGRLHLGVAAGYLAGEMEAVGVPMAERGARTDEYLDAMHALWADPVRSFSGKYVSFGGVDAFPKPVLPGGPRIVIGGHSRPALRRAVARGHGWYGADLDPAATAPLLDQLRELADQVDRPAALGPLEISVTPIEPVDAETATAFAELGVDRLIVYPRPSDSAAQVERFLHDQAEIVVGATG